MALTQVGRYLIKSILSRGKVATAYLASVCDSTAAPDQSSGLEIKLPPDEAAQFVVKLFSPEASADPAQRERFQTIQARLMSIQGQAILPILEMGDFEGQLYLVMPRMAGGSLADRLASGALSLAQSTWLVGRLAAALDAAHAQGVVHGDIKPTNILFDQDDSPYLADFSALILAQVCLGGAPDGLVGPPAYISPEHIRGGAHIDGRADSYMLGVVLFQMLTGHLPFTSETPIGFAVQHLTAPIPKASALLPALPHGCDTIIARALAKRPQDRYTTLAEMAGALENVNERAKSAQLTALSSPPAAASPESAGSEPTWSGMPVTPRTVAAGKRTAPRRWVWGVGAGLLVLLLFVISGVIAFSQGWVDIAWLAAAATPGGSPPPATLTGSIQAAQQPVRPSATLTLMLKFTPTVPLVQKDPPAATAESPAALTPTGEPTVTASPTELLPSPTPTLAPTATPEPVLISTPSAPMTYTIQYNDTLFTIASHFRVDISDFIGVNDLRCDSPLPVGKLLVIPPSETAYLPVYFPFGAADVKKLKLLDVMECLDDVDVLAFSPDGRTLAVASGYMVYLYQVGDWKPLMRLKGHSGAINSIDFSDDGTLIATASDDMTVRLWQASDGVLINTLKGHYNQVTGVAFQPGGQLLASTSRDMTIRLWRVDGVELQQLRGYPAFSAAFSPDGQALAVGYADQVRLYNVSDLSVLQSHPSVDVVKRLVFSPDGALLASSSDVWHVLEARHLYHLQSSSDAVAFSRDGQVLLVGRRSWRISNGSLLYTLKSPLPESERTQNVWDSLALSPDGGLLAWGTPDGLFLWGLPQGVMAEVEPPPYIVKDGDLLFNIANDFGVTLPNLLASNNLICTSPIFIGQHLQIPSEESARQTSHSFPDTPISPDNATRLAMLHTLSSGCVTAIDKVYFPPGDQFLISGSAIWRLETDAVIAQASQVPLNFDGSPQTNLVAPLLSLSPDGSLLAMRVGAQIELWDVASGRLQRILEGHTDRVTALAFSSDGQYLASGADAGDQVTRLWQVAEGSVVQTFTGFTVENLLFSPDGQTLLTFGSDALRFWQIADGTLEHTLQGVGSQSLAVVSPDVSSLAYLTCLEADVHQNCLVDGIAIYRIASEKVSYTIQGYTKKVQHLAFSPDGTILAAASGYAIVLHNSSDGAYLHRLIVPNNLDPVTGVIFSPDGQLLVSTMADNTTRFWRVSDGELIYTLARHQPRHITFSSDGTLMTFLVGDQISLWGIQP